MEYVSLNSIALLKAGGTPSRQKSEYWKNGNIPWLTITDINDKYVSKCKEYITSEGLKNSSAKLFKKGTLIYTIFATVGEVAFLDFDTTTNQAIANIELIDNRFSYEFIYYYLLAIKGKVLYDSKGVAQNNINLGYLKELRIPVIPLQKQQEIVSILDKINAIIDADKKQLKLLDETVKSRFIEMFGDITLNDKGWDSFKLSDKAEIGSSKRIYASEYATSGVPFYRSKEIIELGNKEKPSVELFITEERYKEIKEKYGIPQIGDILMTAVGTIGKFWVVDTDKPFYYKDGNVVYIRAKTINPSFFKYALETLVDNYKQSNANGAAYAALTIVKLKEMDIVVPPMEEQIRFALFMEQINKSKFNIQQHLKLTQELLDKKMDEYFG